MSATTPTFLARIAGFVYLMVFVTGMIALLGAGRFIIANDPAATAANLLAHEKLFRIGLASNLLATVFYVAVTALFYELFKPAGRVLSLTAAFFSIVGCAIAGASAFFQFAPLAILKNAPYLRVFNEQQLQALALFFLRWNAQSGNVAFVFFGCYCLLIGILILKSTFLPRILGVGMLMAAAAWLTFLWPPFAASLAPYGLLPGILGEGALTLWLLIAGVNAQRWNEQARGSL